KHNTIYLVSDFAERWPELLATLGPHRASTACLYLTRLTRVDRAALRSLLERSLADTLQSWPPTEGGGDSRGVPNRAVYRAPSAACTRRPHPPPAGRESAVLSTPRPGADADASPSTGCVSPRGVDGATRQWVGSRVGEPREPPLRAGAPPSGPGLRCDCAIATGARMR